MSTGDPLWLYLEFPLLPLELCYSATEPGPAALCDACGGTLLLCNQAAADAGIKPGLSIAVATALCPALQLCNRRPIAEEQAQLQALALWAGRFSARIALQPSCGLLLEIASMARYFGSPAQLYQQLLAALEPLAFSVRAATGHTPQCARLLAARASGFSDQPRQLQQRLLQLPVTALELPAPTIAQLQGVGIERLDALLQLPREALASRFGESLLDYLDRLTGRRPDPPRYFVPPPRFCRRLRFEQELESSQALLFPLRRLLAELEGFLSARQLLAEQLTLQLQQREGAQQLRLNHSSGEWRQAVWLELWRLKLATLQLRQPLTGLQLSGQRLRARSAAAGELFQQSRGESPLQLLNRLQARLGPSAIHTPRILADHRPERCHGYAAPDPLSSPLPNDAPPIADPQRLLQRPSWLFHQPRPLAGNPDRQRITLLRGPERIVSGWWDQQPVRRDYYVGHWPDGRIGWLFRDDRRRWYQHGWFG